MRSPGLALSVAVLAAGTVAHAQSAGGISNITGDASTTVILPGKDNQNFGAGAGTATGGFAPSGSSSNSFVNIGDTAITFESGNAGAIAQSSSTSSISFRLTNNTDQAVTFKSTITAAGLGFYLADTSGGCLYTGCPQAVGHNFSEFGGQSEVGFNFSVTSTHLNSDGDGCGSESALARCLAQAGMQPRIVNPTPWPEMFDFLKVGLEDLTSKGSRALKGIAREFYAAELDSVQTAKYPGIYTATATLQPCQIQQDASLVIPNGTLTQG